MPNTDARAIRLQQPGRNPIQTTYAHTSVDYDVTTTYGDTNITFDLRVWLGSSEYQCLHSAKVTLFLSFGCYNESVA